MREYFDYLMDIYNETINIISFTNGIEYKEFKENTEKFYAVCRSIEIIGEAAKLVPLEIRLKFPDVPWSSLAKMRDKIIHYYYNADERIIWNTAKRNIPELNKQIELILNTKTRKSNL